MVEMLPYIGEVGYIPGVAEIESFCVEAGVEETDAVAGKGGHCILMSFWTIYNQINTVVFINKDTVTSDEDVVEKVTETRAAPGETEHTRLGSDKSHLSALIPSRIILLTIMSYIMLEEMVIVILPLQPDLWLDFTPDQDSRLLGSHYSGLVCPKLCGGVIVSAMAEGKKGKNVRFGIHLIAGRMPGHFHSFSEDWAPSKPVRDSYLQFANIHSEDHQNQPHSLNIFLKITIFTV